MRTCVDPLQGNWRVERDILAVVHGHTVAARAPLTDAEWAAGWSELRAANVVAEHDELRTRERFESLRAAYAPHACVLAERYYAVRAPWSGDRSPQTDVLWPLRAAESD